jgi:hypothetical protein
MRPEFANEKLTANFSLWEFLESRFFTKEQQARVYQHYSAFEADLRPEIQALAENLQVLRDWLGSGVSINIALRPKWYELEKGRSGNSQHCLGKAADIVSHGYSNEAVQDAIEQLIEDGEMNQGGLGRYDSFTHYDIRGYKARW